MTDKTCSRSASSGLFVFSVLASAHCYSTPAQSSQPTEPLWTDPGIKSAISVRKLISALKKLKLKKALAGNEW